MLDSCFFLLRIVYDADQGRTEKPIADTVSAANLFQYFVVGKVVAIDTLERLMHARIEPRSNRFHGLHVQRAQHIFHLFNDQFNAGSQLLH